MKAPSPISWGKTQSRNQGNKQEDCIKMKGNTISYEVSILHGMSKYTKERIDQLKTDPIKKEEGANLKCIGKGKGSRR